MIAHMYKNLPDKQITCTHIHIIVLFFHKISGIKHYLRTTLKLVTKKAVFFKTHECYLSQFLGS